MNPAESVHMQDLWYSWVVRPGCAIPFCRAAVRCYLLRGVTYFLALLSASVLVAVAGCFVPFVVCLMSVLLVSVGGPASLVAERLLSFLLSFALLLCVTKRRGV